MKNKKVFTITLAIICFLSIIHANAKENNWKLKKNSKGIKVYTRKIENSNFKESKAEMEIETSISSLIFLFTDVDSLTAWYPNLKSCKLLKEISSMEFLMYQVIDLPWPVKDRDSVINFKMKYNRKNGSVTIVYNDYANVLPEKNDLVRIKKIKANWKFIPVSNGKVKVVYQVHGDPGGKLPSWLANSTCVDNPYRIFKKIKNTVVKPRYRNAKLDLSKYKE